MGVFVWQNTLGVVRLNALNSYRDQFPKYVLIVFAILNRNTIRKFQNAVTLTTVRIGTGCTKTVRTGTASDRGPVPSHRLTAVGQARSAATVRPSTPVLVNPTNQAPGTGTVKEGAVEVGKEGHQPAGPFTGGVQDVPEVTAVGVETGDSIANQKRRLSLRYYRGVVNKIPDRRSWLIRSIVDRWVTGSDPMGGVMGGAMGGAEVMMDGSPVLTMGDLSTTLRHSAIICTSLG